MIDEPYLNRESPVLAQGAVCHTTPPLCLNNFASWIELQDCSTYAGLLELIGNALYRQGRFTEGSEVKHVAQALREQHS